MVYNDYKFRCMFRLTATDVAATMDGSGALVEGIVKSAIAVPRVTTSLCLKCVE